jgi:hypothetical protein
MFDAGFGIQDGNFFLDSESGINIQDLPHCVIRQVQAVLRIRYVYPRSSRILIFTNTGSRISDLGFKNSNARTYSGCWGAGYTQCCGSMKFWYGSGSSDQYFFVTNWSWFRIRIRHQTEIIFCFKFFTYLFLKVHFNVADPNPDPHVFGPPGSGSPSQRYGSRSGSGSGSFYHHAKIVRKPLIPRVPTILWLFLTFYLWKIM